MHENAIATCPKMMYNNTKKGKSYLFCLLLSLLPAVDGDPHFMIELPDKNDSLCFNINDKPGTIFNLVRDTTSGQPWVLIIVMTFMPLDMYMMQFLCILLVNQDFGHCQWIVACSWTVSGLTLCCFQVFWLTAKSSETRWFPLMVKLTPTFGDLASYTGL